MPLKASIHAKVEKNCEYHEALAAQYEQLMHQSSGGSGNGKTSRPGEPNASLKYLYELHTEVAKQLREILAGPAANAIEQAVASRTVRRSESGMIPQPIFAHPPRRARMH